MIKKKLKAYFSVFLGINILAGLMSDGSDTGSMFYIIPTFLCASFIVFIFAADIGRYRLSAFTSVLNVLRSRKQGEEEA